MLSLIVISAINSTFCNVSMFSCFYHIRDFVTIRRRRLSLSTAKTISVAVINSVKHF